MLGYDAAVYKSISIDKMIHLVGKEKRVLLTRSKQISSRKEKFSRVLIQSEFHIDQLKELRSYLKLNEEYLFTRCINCNKILYDISKDKIKDLIPEFIFNLIDEYKICRKCGKIFWQGSHYEDMLKVLNKIFD